MTTYVDRPWWRPDYATGIGDLLGNISGYHDAIKTFTENPENGEFVTGFQVDYREEYINEPHRMRDEEGNSKRQIKITNINNALVYVFGDSLWMPNLRQDFNVDLARKLHRIIGEGLINNLGEYRTTAKHPEGYPHVEFLDPNKIPSHMESLFAEVNREIEAGKDDWYDSAMKFFRDFLYIHPFENGNGRVARILLSALLINYCIVPLYLFTKKDECNKVYLNSLSESHAFQRDGLLTSLIIESVHDTLKLCLDRLDIDS